MNAAEDDWCVLLIGGASGTGKSEVSYPLAHQLGVSVLETDDLVTAIKAATTPQQLPILHYWDTHPEAHTWPVHRIEELTMKVITLLQPAFDAVIDDHLDYDRRVIIEGDYLLPALAMDRPRVRGVLLHEPDLEQLIRNFTGREPATAEQRTRAAVSTALGARLTTQALALGVPVITARPWSTAVHRTATALNLAPSTDNS